MAKETFYEAERRRLRQFQKFQLSNQYKKIGIGLFIISIILLFVKKFFVDDLILLRTIAQKGMLVAMLIIAISKEKIEDEMIHKLRGQSFSMAFIAGVIYALIQPLANYVVFKVVKPQKAIYEDLGDFQVLWFMLTIYLLFFYVLKRTS